MGCEHKRYYARLIGIIELIGDRPKCERLIRTTNLREYDWDGDRADEGRWLHQSSVRRRKT